MAKKPFYFMIVALAVISLIFSVKCLALEKLTGFVNDEAGVISPEYRASLEKELSDIKFNTSVEMAVATVKSLGGIPIEEYSLNLAHGTLGEKGKDNGILLFLAVDERQYRIEVGYGLEPVLPASLAGRIGRNVMAPSFKTDDYGKGFLDAVDVIGAILRNESIPETTGTGLLNANNDNDSNYKTAMILFAIMILVFIVISAVAKKAAVKSKTGKGQAFEDDKDFLAAAMIGALFGGGGRGGLGGFGGGLGGGSGGFGGFGGGSFGGGGFSGRF